MITSKNPNHVPDLTPYQPFGIPILKALAGIVLLSIAMVLIYEFVL